MNFLKKLFKKPVTIMFAIIVSLVLGIVATSSMAVNLLPDIAFPFLCVQVVYAGADAETIDENVTIPLNNALSQVNGIHDISTYSLDNASILLVQFDYGTNIEKKESELETKIDTVTLPDDCQKPTISQIDLNSQSIYSLTLYSESNDINDVYQEALKIRDQLLTLEGVGSVKFSGAPTVSLKVESINGLEMFAGLITQELIKNSSLDIPLGEISSSNGNISVSNHSSAQDVEEIENTTIGIQMSDSNIATFKSVQNTIQNIEQMNLEETEEMKQNADDMNKFIDKIESSTINELDDMVENLETIKALVTLIEGNSAPTLNLLWSTTLSPLFENEDFKSMNEDELHDLSYDTGISYNLLKWLQDNSAVNPETGKTYAEEKWKKIVQFRKDHPDEINDEDYPPLFYDIELVSSNPEDEDYMSEEDIIDAVKLSRNVNTVALNNVVSTIKDGDTPTENQYAAMFAYNGNDYLIPITGTTIKVIRSPHFEENYNIFHEYKKNHQHEIEVYDEDTDTTSIEFEGDDIPSEDFISMYNQMTFDDEIEVKPTVKLLDFVRYVDFTSSTVKATISQMADVYIDSHYETSAYYNSKQAIQIDVYGNSGSNATEIAKGAKSIIYEYNQQDDKICEIVSLNNQAEFINDSLSNALVSLLIGSLLAVLVIYLFLRKVKSSLIIAISMPLSVLLTLGCLYLMGITLNMVSIGGIAVGIGMLVDNSIVVLESITREKESGKDVLQASVDGVKLVIGSLIGSTLTSICVFFPILLINGLTKEIFADLSWAVIFSLSFSLLVAITVIPTLFCLFYGKEKKEKEEFEGKVFKKIDNFYVNKLDSILKHKGVTILVAMGVFLGSIGLIFTCPIEFLPSIDQGKIQVNVHFEAGVEESYCQEKTQEAYTLLIDNIDNVTYMSQSVGYTGLIETNQSGTIMIQLNNKAKKTSLVVEDIREVFESNNFSEDYTIVEQDGVVASITGGMSGVSVTISGENVDTLKEIADKIEQDVMSKKGIKHTSNNMLSSSTSYSIEFDKDAIVEKELDYESIVKTLRIGLAGYTCYQVEEDDNDIDVIVSWKEDTIGEYYESLSMFIVGIDSDSSFIHLQDIATITEETGRHIIRKSNGMNVLQIEVESFGIDTNTASNYLKSSAKKVLKDYDGYTYTSGGVSYYLTDAFKGLIIALVIAFFLLFAVMACLFESLRKPIIIIFSFPFAFTGGFLALAITRVSLNVVSFIGLIMLMGVIINDAIVLNERFDQLRENGLAPQDAVKEGCRQRLRAVLMTTLTTVLALIPMALGIGKGAALMQPLGIVAIGGMTIGTLVTLILIPCAYSLIYRINYKKESK